MDVKKFFCCVPIINVRQSVTLSQDKGCQYDSSINSLEVYKNINFTDGPYHPEDAPPEKLYLDTERRRSSTDQKKILSFNDIVMTEGTGSVSSVNTDKSSNHSTLLKVALLVTFGYFWVRKIFLRRCSSNTVSFYCRDMSLSHDLQ